jgi:hypothetical protein
MTKCLGDVVTQLPALLPATFAEGFVWNWVVRHRDNSDGIFHPNAAAYHVPLMKEWAVFSPFGADDIRYFAENDCPEADRPFRELIAEKPDCCEGVAAVLHAYNVRIIRSNDRPKKNGAGRAANFLRDLGITMLVIDMMREFPSMPLYQGKGRKAQFRPPSISSVVAKVVTEAQIGISLEHSAVEKIVERYLPTLAEWLAGTRQGPKFAAKALGYRIYG